jgi:hypothetical protein
MVNGTTFVGPPKTSLVALDHRDLDTAYRRAKDAIENLSP